MVIKVQVFLVKQVRARSMRHFLPAAVRPQVPKTESGVHDAKLELHASLSSKSVFGFQLGSWFVNLKSHMRKHCAGYAWRALSKKPQT